MPDLRHTRKNIKVAIAVMAGVAAIIATEKLWKRGPILARLVGAVSIMVGIVLVARSI